MRRDALSRFVAQPASPTEELASRRHDVLARLQQRNHVVEVEGAGHVQDAVRVDLAHRITVVGGDDPDRRFAAQLTGIQPDFRGVEDQHADQIEARVADHFPQRARPDVAGGPLDDATGTRAQDAGSASVLRSRNSSRPATPISRPMPDCL